MNDLYTETAVKKQKDAKATALKVLIIAADCLLLVGGFLFGQSIVMFLGAVAVVASIYFMPLLNVEYEYIFCDGQFDFDKIMGGNKRKNILKIDMESVEVIAPTGSHELDGYTYQKLDEKKFLSGAKDAKIYVMVGKDMKNNMVKILFEPGEKMLSFAKQKSPRKVVEY